MLTSQLVAITATVSAQPQASAITLSATGTAGASVISDLIISTTTKFTNATTSAPSLASGCSANCTFTVPTWNSGYWKQCEGIYSAGEVKVIVNKASNKTVTSTKYAGKITYTINYKVTTAEASDVMTDDKFVFSRTDINEEGTVTHKDVSGTAMYVPTTFECGASKLNYP